MLNLIAVFFVCSGIGIAIHIAYDLQKNKQSMKIMNAVWILTGLWGSYLALWAYNKFGKETGSMDMKGMDMSSDSKMGSMDMKGMDMSSDSKMGSMNMKGMDMSSESKMGSMDMKGMDMSSESKMGSMDMKGMDMSSDSKMGSMDMKDMDMSSNHPKWESIALSALHCGAGCTLADIIGNILSKYLFHFSTVWADFALDFALALLIGVYFQFYAIREMQKISVGSALIKAIKADFFSLTSWQVGMYGWMIIVYFVIFKSYPLNQTAWIFWFMMQIAMLFGFICAYPMNALLIKLGIKKGM